MGENTFEDRTLIYTFDLLQGDAEEQWRKGCCLNTQF